MHIKDILTPSMKSVRRAYDPRPLWQRRLSADSEFCRAVVAAGYLSQEQMLRAVQRYRLGCSRDGGVIFWQIDQMELIWDGKIMYYRPDCHRDHSRHPNWVSHLLKVHYGCQHLDIPTAHCLFGLHLLKGAAESTTVAVVEAEKTAVILSELFPAYLWLATGGLNELSTIKLFPLRHYRVVLFPDTDEHHQAYSLWYETAQKARRDYGVHCFVSPILERRATPEQKRRKIDLVDLAYPDPIPEQSSPTRSLSNGREGLPPAPIPEQSSPARPWSLASARTRSLSEGKGGPTPSPSRREGRTLNTQCLIFRSAFLLWQASPVVAERPLGSAKNV